MNLRVLAVVLLGLLPVHPWAAGVVGAQDLADELPPGASALSLRLVPVGSASPRLAAGYERDGVIYVAARDLSVLLDATKYWQSELGRLTLVLPGREVTLTVGSDIAVIEPGAMRHLAGSVFRWGGRLYIPLDLFLDETGRAQEWLDEFPLRFDRAARVLSAAGREGSIDRAVLARDAAGWRLLLNADTPIRFDRVRTLRSSFVLLLRDVTYDPLLHPLPPEHEWFQGLRLRNLPEGVELSFSASAAVVGYTLKQVDPTDLEIFLGLDERDLRTGTLSRFGTAEGLVPEEVRVIALDAGHGGDDTGATLGETSEAWLSAELCRSVATLLRLELDVEAVVIRDDHENPSADERAERANHAGADLYLALHVHPRGGGVAAFVGMPGEGGEGLPRDAASLGFRASGRGQGPYLNSSRLLARSLVDAIAARRSEDPQGVFGERLPELMGTAMPATLIEIPGGTDGTAPGAREVQELARAIVEGIQIFMLSGEEP